jgi:hypothetical protein
MYRQTLLLLAACLLFANFTCPEECESIFFSGSIGAALTVELSNSDITYAVGDEFELSANFSALLDGPRGLSYTISENGGLIITEVYRINPDTFLLEPALDAFTVEVETGEQLPNPAEDNLNAVVRTQYRCPGRACSFRQSFRALSPGSYVLRVSGGPIDEIQADFNYCEAPKLLVTDLVGGGNPGPADTVDFFETPYIGTFFFLYDPFIAAEGQRNAYFFTVE